MISAREALRARLPDAERERAPRRNSDRERQLAGRFADAVESDDIDEVVALLTDDALLTMPPPARVPGARGDRGLPALSGGAVRRGAARRAHPGQHSAGVRLLPPGRACRDRSPLRTDRADARRGGDRGDHLVRRHRPLPTVRTASNAAEPLSVPTSRLDPSNQDRDCPRTEAKASPDLDRDCRKGRQRERGSIPRADACFVLAEQASEQARPARLRLVLVRRVPTGLLLPSGRCVRSLGVGGCDRRRIGDFGLAPKEEQ
jgi:hypothetical protein